MFPSIDRDQYLVSVAVIQRSRTEIVTCPSFALLKQRLNLICPTSIFKLTELKKS